ncbi:MAG: hypothetical protein ACSLE2_15320 [Lysobacterales bacterium]
MQTILGAGGAIGLEMAGILPDHTDRVRLVSRTLRELKEMAYQYDRDYDFRSEKFERRFGFVPTGYEQGIKAIVEADHR